MRKLQHISKKIKSILWGDSVRATITIGLSFITVFISLRQLAINERSNEVSAKLNLKIRYDSLIAANLGEISSDYLMRHSAKMTREQSSSSEYYDENSYSFDRFPTLKYDGLFKISNDHINSHNLFVRVCILILKEKNGLKIEKIEQIEDARQSTVVFSKTFERGFFQSLFGPKRVMYRGVINAYLPATLLSSDKIESYVIRQSCELSYDFEWRKYFNELSYEKGYDNECPYSVDAIKILDDFMKWSPKSPDLNSKQQLGLPL